ncbi:hypothetical protein EDD63_10380 [Breznakia blatticola]|uniref:Carbohydrate kinase PfkB domain-containing protein n=1 Tax=Breznakia blatticola TaxID=1754012 RepID=A0A4R8A5V6_9FIRM|nr:hypothetical protein [Breznakia blatticola]TDW25793.1 hypothetical protein EDD63_10380 [Breznakia blatticola]
MIQILSLYPYLQKVVRGKTDEDGQFYSEHITYQVMGDGLQCQSYIQQEGLACKQMMMLASDATKFVDIANTEVLEITAHNKLQVSMYEDDTLLHSMTEHEMELDGSQMQLYRMLAQSKLQKSDIAIICDGQDASTNQLEYLSQMCKEHVDILVGVLPVEKVVHQDVYYNVLVFDFDELAHIYEIDALDQDKIQALTTELHKYARIIVLAMKNNRIIVSVENQMYYGSCAVKDESNQSYLGAIASGIAICYENEGDITRFIQECLARNVASSLSSGIFAGSKDTVEQIKSKIVCGKLEKR